MRSVAIIFKVIFFLFLKNSFVRCKKKYGVGGGCVQRANHNHFEGRQSPLDYCRNIYKNRWYY